MNDRRIGSHGRRMSLAECERYRRNPPAEANQRANGSTPIQRMDGLTDAIRQLYRGRMEANTQRLADRAFERVEGADDLLDLIEERLDEWDSGLDSGRLTDGDIFDNLRGLHEPLAAARSEYDAAAADAEAGRAFLGQTEEEFEKQQIDRFPRLADSLPLVTEAWLRGEPDARDPLATPAPPDDGSKVDAANHLAGA